MALSFTEARRRRIADVAELDRYRFQLLRVAKAACVEIRAEEATDRAEDLVEALDMARAEVKMCQAKTTSMRRAVDVLGNWAFAESLLDVRNALRAALQRAEGALANCGVRAPHRDWTEAPVPDPRPDNRLHCKYFWTLGFCNNGHTCKFRHVHRALDTPRDLRQTSWEGFKKQQRGVASRKRARDGDGDDIVDVIRREFPAREYGRETCKQRVAQTP